jgi:pyridoxamine 5'-phosphate oxidase
MKNDAHPHSVPVADLRVSYALATFDTADADPDPFAQFKTWLEQAIEAEIPEPNAMALATTGSDGMPSVRTVLLKGADSRGLSFFTNYESQKARELAENPRAAVLFLWKELQRQVIVSGQIEKCPHGESEAYFHSRPRGHQIGAWVSKQSSVIPDRTWMETREREFQELFPENTGPIPLPEFWGGYRLLPSSFEFWQGRVSRLHDRIRYSGDARRGWEKVRLSP